MHFILINCQKIKKEHTWILMPQRKLNWKKEKFLVYPKFNVQISLFPEFRLVVKLPNTSSYEKECE